MIKTLYCSNRIVGPRCLLSCFLNGQSIPEGSAPVFNTAMRDVIVSASGFSGTIKVIKIFFFFFKPNILILTIHFFYIFRVKYKRKLNSWEEFIQNN